MTELCTFKWHELAGRFTGLRIVFRWFVLLILACIRRLSAHLVYILFKGEVMRSDLRRATEFEKHLAPNGLALNGMRLARANARRGADMIALGL